MRKIKDSDIENLVASTMKNIENTYLSDKFMFALLLSKNNNYADEYLGKLNALKRVIKNSIRFKDYHRTILYLYFFQQYCQKYLNIKIYEDMIKEVDSRFLKE